MDRVVDTMGSHQLYPQHIGSFRLLKSKLNEIFPDFHSNWKTHKTHDSWTISNFYLFIYSFIAEHIMFCLFSTV